MGEEKKLGHNGHGLVTTGDEVSLSKALWTYFGMLAVAMFLSYPSFPFPQGIVLAPYFPAGLATLFASVNGAPFTVLLAIGYAFYILLFVFFITVRTKKAFIIEVLIFASILIMNIAGCHNNQWPR
jgi:hypothetical protein